MVVAMYLIYYNTLLQNVRDITKCNSYFITKCDKSSSQNVSRSLLQNAAVFLQNATVITKCNIYYNTCWYTDKCFLTKTKRM